MSIASPPPKTIVWKDGHQWVVYQDGRPSRPLKQALLDADRYEWMSDNYDAFMAILKAHPGGGAGIEWDINFAMATKEHARQQQLELNLAKPQPALV